MNEFIKQYRERLMSAEKNITPTRVPFKDEGEGIIYKFNTEVGISIGVSLAIHILDEMLKESEEK